MPVLPAVRQCLQCLRGGNVCIACGEAVSALPKRANVSIACGEAMSALPAVWLCLHCLRWDNVCIACGEAMQLKAACSGLKLLAGSRCNHSTGRCCLQRVGQFCLVLTKAKVACWCCLMMITIACRGLLMLAVCQCCLWSESVLFLYGVCVGESCGRSTES